MRDLTYPSPGLTAGEGEPALPGFHTLRISTGLPTDLFDAAADALFGWRMHGAVPLLRVDADQPQAATGVRVVLRFWPVAAPCRVVWAVRDENRAAFAYGTLPGHPESGEEAFVLQRDPADGAVTFTVLAVSRPATWYARAAGPLGRILQRTIAVRYAKALRTAAARTP